MGDGEVERRERELQKESRFFFSIGLCSLFFLSGVRREDWKSGRTGWD